MLHAHMKIQFEVFRGTFSSWNSLFAQAAEFANSLAADRLINISHSADNSDGVVVVWYRG